MGLQKYSTIKLVEELKRRGEAKVFKCGLYNEYNAEIKRKYSQDRAPIKLPNDFTLIVVEDLTRG